MVSTDILMYFQPYLSDPLIVVVGKVDTLSIRSVKYGLNLHYLTHVVCIMY